MNNDIIDKLGITLNAMQEVTAEAVLHTGRISSLCHRQALVKHTLIFYH